MLINAVNAKAVGELINADKNLLQSEYTSNPFWCHLQVSTVE